MPRLSRSIGLLGALSSALALCVPSEANACGGGTFYDETQVSSGENIATTGHRVVIALSKTQTVLWDQIEFTGAPEDFAWVYPIKPGAVLEVATDAWTEALGGATAKTVYSPTELCFTEGDYTDDSSGQGCSMSCAPGADGGGVRNGGGDDVPVGGEAEDPVQVVHSSTAGPYETVTISSAVPGAIGQWLQDNGYNVPADATPVLDAYAADGFDFIALRLTPGNGVSLMKPVRVVTPGPTTTFPMRMLGVGAAEKVALNVLVIGEGRVQVDGYTNVAIDPTDVIWDWDSDTSNYSALRTEALSQDGGAAFLTSYSKLGELFAPGSIEIGTDEAIFKAPIAEQYLSQANKNGEAKSCLPGTVVAKVAPGTAESSYTVVDVCDEQGTCGTAGPNEIDSRDLACEGADDLAVALIGMHPADVWITRLEANLPKSALDKDLVLTPVAGQSEVPAELLVSTSIGDACDSVSAVAPPAKPRSPLPPSMMALLAAGAALASAVARRLSARRQAVSGTIV
jgi:hypothetical protein